MTAFPKYPAYKDSGVEWLGEVPEHWNAEKGKWLFNLMERPPRKEDEIVTAFRDGQVTLRINRRTEGFTNAIKEHGYQGIRKGDLVIHAMDAFAGAIGVSDSDGKSTPVYSACVPRQPNSVNPYFYAYLLRHMAHSGFITTLAKGIRERSTNFSFTDFAALRIPMPSKLEQDHIVAFLNEKTAQIEALIAKKQRQIELLDEQKAILINRAVTRGLHPQAELQDSGIEGVGQVPAHWQIVQNRRLFTEKSRKITNPDEMPLSLSQVDGVIPSDEMKERSLSPSHRDNFKLCLPGDLILNRFKAHLGVFFESPYRGAITYHYGVFEPHDGIQTKYFEFLFHTEAYRTIYAGVSNGMSIGLQNLSNNNFYQVLSVVPPEEEQDAIVKHAERVVAATVTAIQRITTQIQTLQTLRSTLIAHAVTGKIKVA
jgi:type I restriction enzyme S subunit